MAASQARSVRQVCMIINDGKRPSGGTQNHVARLLRHYGIDTSHFSGQGHRKGFTFGNEFKGADHYFKVLEPDAPRTSVRYLRRALIEVGVPYQCATPECGISEWNGKPLTLQVDHVDGNCYNNLRDNLRFLCPNCHTQTETWGASLRSPTAEAIGREPIQ